MPPSPDPSSPAVGVVGPAGRRPGLVVAFVLTVAALLAADLFIKAWAFARVAGVPVELTRGNAIDPETIPDHDAIVVVPRLLHLRLTTNPGAVFGLGKGAQLFFIAVTLAVVPTIGVFFARSPARAHLYHAALAMILAGALGNLYDRVRFNAVRDMFLMLPGTGLWPWIFNFADAILVVGVATLMLILWRSDKRPGTAPAARG